MNPFRPTFGTSPPAMVGRDELVDEFAIALDDGPGAPGRATIYTGPRGSGKTVLLNAVEDVARRRGWIVISETAAGDLVERLETDHLPTILADIAPTSSTRLTGIDAPFGLGGASWEHDSDPPPSPSLRSLLGRAADAAAANGTGVLLTIDEIHSVEPADIREIATTIQHMFREDREVAIVVAGLPDLVEERLYQDAAITFLRRADRHRVGLLTPTMTAEGLRAPIEQAGRQITDEALSAAVDVAAGYPFMVQVVGHATWRQQPDAPVIELHDVERAATYAIERVGQLVHAPSLAGLSTRDRDFLAAMALDDGPSRMADIAHRMGVDKNYAGQYRRRLLASELVDAPSRGHVDFALPYLRDYVRGLDIELDDPDA